MQPETPSSRGGALASPCFITGTDTGAGKTVLTGLLLAHLRRRGIHALAMKPFLSGGWEDARLLSELQDGELGLEEIAPFYFPEPVAPAVSGRKHRRSVPLEAVLEKIFSLRQRCEVLLVEGIGGLRVPLNDRYTVAEVIAALRGPVWVAAADRLGAINHTLLTVNDLHSIGVQHVTIALMECKRGGGRGLGNAATLRRWVKPHRVFELPWGGEIGGQAGAILRIEKKFQKVVARVAGSGRVFPVAAR